jgi:hypothetical protein
MEPSSPISKRFAKLFGHAPKPVSDKAKELRFTRSRQASFFFLLAALSAATSISIAVAMFSKWGPHDPDFKKWIGFSLLPLIPCFISLKLALHCVRHAYLILTPMGVEIFPFFHAQKKLKLIYWHEIHSSHCDSNAMTLHYNAERSSGCVVSLKPIATEQISLLQRAINARTNSN